MIAKRILVQSAHTNVPRLVTEFDAIIYSKLAQFRNADSSMVVTELGMAMDANVQLRNAESPIVVTESGTAIGGSAKQLRKVEASIVVYSILSGILTVVNPVALTNAYMPIKVTESGIKIYVSVSHPSNAPS